MKTVPNSTRPYFNSQSGDGASNDCCWLESVLQVCASDVTILQLGRCSGASTVGLVRNSSSRLAAMKPQPNGLL